MVVSPFNRLSHVNCRVSLKGKVLARQHVTTPRRKNLDSAKTAAPRTRGSVRHASGFVQIVVPYRKCVGAVQTGKFTSVSRRGICDRTIWRKPLAFAADAEGYKYIVWVFNARFAILSPELCPPSSFIAMESLGTAACYHATQKNSCFHENSRPRARASVRRAAASSKSPL